MVSVIVVSLRWVTAVRHTVRMVSVMKSNVPVTANGIEIGAPSKGLKPPVFKIAHTSGNCKLNLPEIFNKSVV